MVPRGSLVGVLARGGAVRVAAHAAGTLLVGLSAVVVLRALEVQQYGAYATAVALVSVAAGVGDAGLAQHAQRLWAVQPDEAARRALLAAVLGLRLLLLPAAVAVAALVAVGSGRGSAVAGAVLLAGAGAVLHAAGATLAVPSLGALRYGRAASVDLARQAVLAVGLAALAVAGAGVPLLLLAHLAGGAAALLLAVVLLPLGLRARPRLAGTWQVLRPGLPLSGAVVLRAVLLALPVLAAGVLGGSEAAGLVGASQRVVEVVAAVLSVAVGTLLPVLVAGEEHARRQSLVARLPALLSGALLAGGATALVLVVLAGPVVRLLAGDGYAGAAQVLQVHALLLVSLPLVEVLVLALLSERLLRGVLTAHAAGLLVALVVTAAGAVAGAGAARLGVLGVVTAEVVLALVCLRALGQQSPALAATVRGWWPACRRTAGCLLLGAGTASVLPLGPLPRAAAALAALGAAAVVLRVVPRRPEE